MGMKIGDFSPLAGMLTGKGALGEAMRQGFGGMIPQAIARDAFSEGQAKKMATMPSAGMKKGGTASSRADGVAQRGKTRGTIVMCGGGMARGKK